jgi:hypothetical protein
MRSAMARKNEPKYAPPKETGFPLRQTDRKRSAHPKKSEHPFGVPLSSPTDSVGNMEELWLKNIRKKEGEECSRVFT